MSGNNSHTLSQFLTQILLIFLHPLSLIQSSVIPPPPPFNLSHFLYPRVTTFIESNTPPPQPSHFLQAVVDAIADKEKWAMEDVRLSKLYVKKAKYRPGLRYELRVRLGKAQIVLNMYDELSEWKKLGLRENGTSNFETLARNITAKSVIDSFKVEGPFELRVTGDDEQLSLMLPLNITRPGLRRVSVGEGITVDIKGAQEISIFHPSANQLPHGISNYRKLNNVVRSIRPGSCKAPPSIRILGPASASAYRKQRPAALIRTASISADAIKLLPSPNYEKPSRLLSSLSTTRIASLERALTGFLNERGNKYSDLGCVKTRLRALAVFRVRLEMERDVRVDDTLWSTLAEWRTRPTTERVLFEVVARIEGDVLKPVVIEKVGPVIDTDTYAWSSLSSNISFTKFPSALVPPEALTLDVKW